MGDAVNALPCCRPWLFYSADREGTFRPPELKSVGAQLPSGMTLPDPAVPDKDTHLTPNSEIYQPPTAADATDELDASVDGTSASHYGANDPALYESPANAPD